MNYFTTYTKNKRALFLLNYHCDMQKNEGKLRAEYKGIQIHLIWLMGHLCKIVYFVFLKLQTLVTK